MNKKAKKENNNTMEVETELDLRSLFNIFWDRKYLILGITSLFFIFSIIFSLQIPDQYKATTSLAPSENKGGSLTQSVSSQLGGLAGLAGLRGMETTANEAELAIEIMQSWGFVESFIKNNNIEAELLASEGWDEKTNKLVINQEVYDVDNSAWIEKKPSSWQQFKLFSEIFEVRKNRDSVTILLSLEFYSPLKAKEWLDLYVVSINNYMRERKIRRVEKNIDYLQSQIAKTSMSEMKAVFFNLIEEQTKILMLAEANIDDYVFMTVSKSMVPEQKSYPFRRLIVIQFTLIGGILSVLIVFLLRAFKR